MVKKNRGVLRGGTRNVSEMGPLVSLNWRLHTCFAVTHVALSNGRSASIGAF